MSSEIVCRNAPLEHPLWTFSLALYNQPGVAAHVLERQEAYHIWVNDWLFAVWLAQQQRIIHDDFALHMETWQAWREAAVMPWRSLRMALREPGLEGLHQRTLETELRLEQADQAYLYARQGKLSELAPPSDLTVLIVTSLQRLSVELDQAVVESSAELLSAATSRLFSS
ncbi:TIGR02444 family protein [Salinispirillum marinum]|uniref:TIGR02444 family protein n=2 Tax=Saccharospirillaceae TaxID=255527 RepID=A0ABV8BDZ6_9GAMM